MVETSALKKLCASIINAVIVIVLYIPIYLIVKDIFIKKLLLIMLFFLYNFFFLIFNNNRCLGMVVMKTRYKEEPSLKQGVIYNLLYTLSFSSLFFWVYFPFDLFLFNMLFIQLPMVLITKTTLHGYLAGNITTVEKPD